MVSLGVASGYLASGLRGCMRMYSASGEKCQDARHYPAHLAITRHYLRAKLDVLHKQPSGSVSSKPRTPPEPLVDDCRDSAAITFPGLGIMIGTDSSVLMATLFMSLFFSLSLPP